MITNERCQKMGKLHDEVSHTTSDSHMSNLAGIKLVRGQGHVEDDAQIKAPRMSSRNRNQSSLLNAEGI